MGNLYRMAAKSKKFSKEDELLLQDFSRGVSTKSSALFYGNALIVSSIPVWLYWRVHNIDPASSAFILAAVTKEMNAKLADDKKISRKEKDERILWKKNEVAEYEATTFSIFYNNALFLAILIICSFYIFKTFTPVVNYVGAMSLATGIVALLSTGFQ